MLLRILGLLGIALVAVAVVESREELGLLIDGERATGTIVAKTLDDKPDNTSVWSWIWFEPPVRGFILVRFVDLHGEHMVAERISYFESLFDIGQKAEVVYHATYPEGARVSRYLLLVWPALALVAAGCMLLGIAGGLAVFRAIRRRIADRLAMSRNPDIRSDLTKSFDAKKLFERRDD